MINTSDILIEPIPQNQAAMLTPFYKLVFGSVWSEESFEKLLARPRCCAFAAKQKEGNILQGFILAFCISVDEAEINIVAVHPEYQRQGLGRSLCRTVLTDLKDRGIETVYLEVNEHNLPALSLYHSFGFSVVGRRKDYYPQAHSETGKSARDGLIMRLTHL